MKANKKEKTIKLNIYFHTSGITKEKGEIKPRTCWDQGAVYVRSNSSHGIAASKEENFFYNFLELPSVIAQALAEAGVTVQLKTGDLKKIVAKKPKFYPH